MFSITVLYRDGSTRQIFMAGQEGQPDNGHKQYFAARDKFDALCGQADVFAITFHNEAGELVNAYMGKAV